MDDDPRITNAGVDRALTRLEAASDAWAVEVDLPAMVKNIVSPMRLNRNAPDDVREQFTARMEQQIDAIIRQAFIEGSYRNHCDTADIILPCDVSVASTHFVSGSPLAPVIREIARIGLAALNIHKSQETK